MWNKIANAKCDSVIPRHWLDLLFRCSALGRLGRLYAKFHFLFSFGSLFYLHFFLKKASQWSAVRFFAKYFRPLLHLTPPA